jgi:hypothetical protein
MVQLMTVLTLGVALWEYRNADGRKHRAYYGQQLDVTDAELERGERANVFAAQTEEGVSTKRTPPMTARTPSPRCESEPSRYSSSGWSSTATPTAAPWPS